MRHLWTALCVALVAVTGYASAQTPNDSTTNATSIVTPRYPQVIAPANLLTAAKCSEPYVIFEIEKYKPPTENRALIQISFFEKGTEETAVIGTLADDIGFKPYSDQYVPVLGIDPEKVDLLFALIPSAGAQSLTSGSLSIRHIRLENVLVNCH